MVNLLLLNMFFTTFMFGVIILTQFVTYPLLLNVKSSNFHIYHDSYVKKIFLIVAPAMVIEFLLGLYILFITKTYLTIINFILISVIFASTIFLQVPIHDIIKSGKDVNNIKRLIKTNWIRSSMWFLKVFVSYKLLIKEVV